MEGMRNAYDILDGKPERKRPLRNLKRTWENNIKTDLKQGVRVRNEMNLLMTGSSGWFY
jgi:hypothetical protein